MATAVEAIPSSYDLDTTNVIGLLKAIAAGEAEGGRRLAQWAAMTSDPKLVALIEELVERKNAIEEDTAERRFIVRQLAE